jgi:magnesium chelatase subunit D
MKPVYPWSAVVGQPALKQALLLCAIDPAIGGVLVQGPRGVAKTTLARALGQLVQGPFVELPLGASEERVTGSLELESVLRDGKVAFAPGLLARAHQGVLYVDEVNLLPDALVDLLLDAAASGQNTVERDGVSHVHPARFVLVGTMNPDEGELRPQLTDRFGLAVEAESEIKPAERAQIVTLRLQFDDDAAAFVERYQREQAELVLRCTSARERARNIALVGPALERVSELCYAAGVEGVRADLAMLRAARAHAAWHARGVITIEDVDAVAELALAHRRRAGTPPPSGPGSSGAPPRGSSPDGARGPSSTRSSPPHVGAPQVQADDRPAREQASSAQLGSAHRDEVEGPSPAGRHDDAAGAGETGASAATHGAGALAAVPVRAGTAPSHLPAWLTAPQGPRSEARKRGAGRQRAPRGQRTASSARATGTIDWFGTIAAAAGTRPLCLSRADLRYRARRAPHMQLWVVAVDCSASMLRGGALASAKAIAAALEASALRRGAHLALLSFSGSSAQLEAAPTAARSTRQRALQGLGGSGGTPLRASLHQAHALCTSRRFQARDVTKRIVLLTDGRSREPVHDLAAEDPSIDVVVIDCERGALRLARAEQLARALKGRYLHVDSLIAR